MKRGISLEVIWFDDVEDLIEVTYRCSNGFFSGGAEMYVSSLDLSKFAEALARPPSNPDDIRDFELGTFNPDSADGGVRMHFRCKRRGRPCSRLGKAARRSMQSVR